MKANELFESVEPGTTIYHGTAAKNAIGIMKHGLLPRPNRWEDKYVTDPSMKRQGEVAVFCSPHLDDAIQFAETGGWVTIKGVVFAFTILPTDQIEKGRFVIDELLVRNVISPDRLSLVWPASAVKKFDQMKSQASASFNKTNIIKQVNLLTKPFGWYIRSASKTTQRVLTYKTGNEYYQNSILLDAYPQYLASIKCPLNIVAQVQSIIKGSQ